MKAQMGDKKAEVNFEGTMSIDRVLAYLDELVASFRTGTVRVEKGLDAIVLTPAEVIDLDVKAKIKKDKQSLQLELSWATDTLRIGERHPKVDS